MFSGDSYQRKDYDGVECGCCANIGKPPIALNAWEGLKHIVQHNVRLRDSHFRATGSYIYIYVWTIDDVIQMSWLIRSGVDGIITNRPNLLAKVCQTISR